MISNEIPNVPLRDKHSPEAFFAEEKKGWHGYIEWEKYPEKQKKAADILAQYKFAGVSSPKGYYSSTTNAACCVLGA